MVADLSIREEEIFKILKKIKDFDIVLIGGYAINAYTLPRFSIDCDIVIKDGSIVKNIIDILRGGGFIEDEQSKIETSYRSNFKRFIKKIDNLEMSFDLLIGGVWDRQTETYIDAEWIFVHSKIEEVRGRTFIEKIKIKVLSREALIVLKLISGRIQDLRDVFMLFSGQVDYEFINNEINKKIDFEERFNKLENIILQKQFKDNLQGVYGKVEDKLFEKIKNNTLMLNKNIYKQSVKPSFVMKRTNTCGELTKKDNKKEVVLCGWMHSRRDHGGIIFIDLRDRYGLTQIVFDPKHDRKVHSEAEHLRREDVLQIKGKVRPRGKGLENPKLKTGEIEVLVDELDVLNKAETPPIEVDDRIEINEDMRLKYRYIDLRKPKMQKNLEIRHKAVKAVRDFLDKEGFLEIETPMLARSTPEGARDYLVPSRVNPGKFYALPQSPQLFKQLLMVSGCDRYFQIVKCFRDEDLRADRQPEFTQIDVEMSFIDQEDIYDVHERLMRDVWKKVLGVDIKLPFKRLTYDEAMDKYGTDKPDIRFGLELVDVTDIIKGSSFKVFTDNIKSGGIVKAINVKKSPLSRKEIDELISFVQIYDAKGLAWMKMTDKGLESSVVKFFSDKVQRELIKKLKAVKGDLLLFVSDHKHFIVNDALGNLRVHLAKKLDLIPKDSYSFVWVTDFPLVEYDENEQRHMAVHHPFTSPKDEDLKLLEKSPKKVKAKAYDLTLNGVEIGGGSIRIHKREIQEKVFKVLGISQKEAHKKFGFLLEAFRYGAPPHGGIAFGMDRIVALLTGNESIREVIAFPKTKNAESLMEGSPSEVSDKQLKELNIKLDVVKK